jgi:hypothetical protein
MVLFQVEIFELFKKHFLKWIFSMPLQVDIFQFLKKHLIKWVFLLCFFKLKYFSCQKKFFKWAFLTLLLSGWYITYFLWFFFLATFFRLKFTHWKNILEMYVFFFGWCFFFSFCWAWIPCADRFRHSVVSDSDSNCRFVDERKEDDCRACSLE